MRIVLYVIVGAIWLWLISGLMITSAIDGRCAGRFGSCVVAPVEQTGGNYWLN